MATAAGGIATPKNIVDYIGSSTALGMLASSTSTVANRCITYGILSSSSVNTGIFNITGTYTNEKCVKFSDISKKVTLGLTFTPNSFSFTAGGGSATATFTSTNGSVNGVPYSATKPTWISVSGTVGLAALSASANTSTSSRSGTVYISSAISGSTLGSSAVGTVYVTQAGSAAVTISKITVSPTTVNAVVGSVSGINSVSYVSGTVTYSNGTTKPVGSDTNCSAGGSNSTYALAWQAGSGIAFNTLAVGNSTITIQGGEKSVTLTLNSTSPTINTKLSSILKCCLIQGGVTTVSVGDIDIFLSNNASGSSNLVAWQIPTSYTGMRTISGQSGVFTINNFNLAAETSYINSTTKFNSLYVRIYISGITWTGSNTSKTVSLCKYSTSGSGTPLINIKLSNGAPFDSGFISLNSFTDWYTYNTPTYTATANLVRCNTARVVPMTLYIR